MKHFEGNPYQIGSWVGARLLIGLLLFEVCVSVLRTAAASCSAAPGGLVGWWPADGNANNIVGADHGSLQGGATANVPGVVGLAFSFDGTNGYVQIPDSTLLRPSNLTVEAWVQFASLDSVGTSSAGQQYIVFKQNTRSSDFEGFGLLKTRGTNGDTFEFRVSSAAGQVAAIASLTQVATGAWYHVAGVRGSNFLQLYVNGQLAGQTDATFPQDYGDWPLYFGSTGQPNWEHKLAGLLDEVGLYNRALSGSEIAGIFAAGSAGKCKAVSLTLQPQEQIVVVGSNANFTADATGVGVLSYQWQRDGVDLAGASSTNLVLTNVQPADAGNYTVVVTNLLSAVTSSVAVLTVLEPPVITVQPVSQELVLRALPACTGGTCATVAFGATATGTPPLSFQWQREGISLANNTRITGATEARLVLSGVEAGDAGSYTMLVSNVAGVTTSTVAALTVAVPLIPDLNLEDAVRQAISKPAGALSCADLQNLTNLMAFDAHILDLSGLECAVNLEFLCLGGNDIGNLGPLRNLNRLSALLLYNNHGKLRDIAPLSGLSNLTYLDIRSNPAISNMAEVVNLRSLTNVFLGGNGLSEVTFLTNLTGLRSLDLDHNNVTNLSFLAVLPKLMELDVGYNPGTDFSSLSGLTNLTSLYISGNSVGSLSFLQGLTRLTTLNLYSNNITDISPLAGMADLSWLNLGGNPVADYSQLAGLTKLGSLWLYGNRITNVPSLQGLGQLRYLMLDDNRIADLRSAALPTGLASLSLERNQITNCAELSPLTHLTHLGLGSNFISDVSALTTMSQLTSLSLYSNSLSEVSGLAGLTNLAALNLGANRFTNLAGLSGMSNLSSLWLFGNSIRDVASLGRLGRLRCLDLGDNRITNAAALGGLFNLSALNLSSNSLTDWSFFTGLTNLSEIYLGSNALTSLGFMQSLTKLRTVNLNQNLLSDLSAASGLTNLRSLHVEHNRLTEISGIQCLPRIAFADLRMNLLDLSSGAQFMVQCLTNRSVAILYGPQSQGPKITFGSLPSLAGTNYWPMAMNKTSSLKFSVLDDVIGATQVVVRASSSNGQLIPEASLLLEGTRLSRSLTVTPTAGQTGTTVLSLTATDELGLRDTVTILARVSEPVVIPDPNLRDVISSVALVPANELSEGALFSLTRLIANDSDITNLWGLQWATNLTGLYLNGNSISDCTFLQGLTRLNFLSLSNNLISSLWPLAGLTNLKYLDMSANPITNYSSLPGLTNLATLYLDDNAISNCTFLQGLSQLRFLSLNNNRVSDLSPLTSLTNLVYLSLSSNPITNYSGLSGLTNLTGLALAENSISNLNFLVNLTHLVALNLSTNKLSDLPPLVGLTNLDSLELQQNRLTDIVALTNLLHLTYLDIRLNLLGAENDPAIEALQAFAEVRDTPQREPPFIDVRTNWLVAPHTTSSLLLNLWDSGPRDEQLGLGIKASSPELVCSVVAGPDGFWTLTVTPTIEPDGTNAMLWVGLTATNDVGFSADTLILVEVTALSSVDGTLLGAPGLSWTNGGDVPWFGQSVVARNGHSVAQSGAIGNDQASRLQTTLVGPGRLSFWWKVSSEENYDFFKFSLGAKTISISGEVDWYREVVNVPPGLQTAAWVFRKDMGASSGLDAAWLDQVTFEPGIWLEITGAPNAGRRELILHAVPGRLYEIQASTNLANWFDPSKWFRVAPVVLATNTAQYFTDTNAFEANRSYRLHEVFVWLDSPVATNVGQVQIILHNTAGLELELEFSNDLLSWNLLGRVTNTAPSVTFIDAGATNSPVRFYRARVRP